LVAKLPKESIEPYASYGLSRADWGCGETNPLGPWLTILAIPGECSPTVFGKRRKMPGIDAVET
jgi:hypothetical protein